MEDEGKKFNFTNFFIKGIIVIIFVLFTVWLLSLSNKGINKSLNVLTDKIFADNIERMKEAGISYFTNERLPQKIGEMASISLEKMYDEKLLLEIKDKDGNVCSVKNSYVSVEKFNGYEYHMKVYLECGEEKDYINVILGCYDYCDNDVCEKEEIPVIEERQLEYEYSKTNGGYWTDWGVWSEWSKVLVTKTNYRDVETKVVKEQYSYDKLINKVAYINPSCPSGYTRTGFTCTKNYNKTPICPSGYTRTGFTCTKNYNKMPVCPSGYTRDGFTCTKNYNETPVCPSGYTRDGFTCKKQYYENLIEEMGVIRVDKHWNSKCNCQENIPVYGVVSRYCPSGTTQSGNTCIGYTETSATCPSGTTQSGNTCIGYTQTSATCPSGTTQSGNTCVGYTQTSATCPSGTTQSGNTCVGYTYERAVCPDGYTPISSGNRCYRDASEVIQVSEERDVTYYRYRLREYVGGIVDYKWSSSKNDKKLIEEGYKLTGRTRELGGK